MTALLALAEVSKRFPGVVALDGVSFDLMPGEVHALVGENGAGKSTLIKLISGVYAPDAGQILLDGKPAALASPVAARRLGIATVHQEADLFGTLSVAENMALGQGLPRNRLGLVDWSAIQRSARAAIEALHEPISAREAAGRLSVGQRHMIQVAAAVSQHARIVIMDEPTSALSEAECGWLFEQIDRLKSSGVGIIYVSHRQDEIFRLSDRITVLRDGRRVWSGQTAKVDRKELVRLMVGREESLERIREHAELNPQDARPVRLSVRGLSDRAGRVREVSLEARASEILGVYGLVGSGRSEWAQTLFGWRKRAAGTILIDQSPSQVGSPAHALAQGLAYLPEDRLRQAICPGLSIRANTVLSALRRLSRGPIITNGAERRAALSQTEALGVKLRSVEQPLAELSGGNQQKVVLGRMRLTEPRVLILDEPTRGVDVGAKAEIHRLVRELADTGCAVVMISSDLAEVLAYSDRIAVFRSGAIAAEFEAASASAEQVATAALPDEAEAQTRATRPAPATRPLVTSEIGLLLALLVLGVAMSFSTGGRFLVRENLISVVSNASVLTVLALGSAAVIIAGAIDISVGSLLALAAAAAGLVLQDSHGSIGAVILAIGLGLLVGMAGGCLNALIALAGQVHPIIVTLGSLTVFRGLMISLTGGEVISSLPRTFRVIATGRTGGLPGSVWILLAAIAAAATWLKHTRAGRHVFAFGSNPAAARLVGIRRGRVWLGAFAIGGLAAAVAGLLELALNGSMQSGMGTGYELRAIAAAVIGGTAVTGGRGSAFGVFLGALLLSLIQNALVLWSVSRYQYDLVIGGLLLAAILVDLALRRWRL